MVNRRSIFVVITAIEVDLFGKGGRKKRKRALISGFDIGHILLYALVVLPLIALQLTYSDTPKEAVSKINYDTASVYESMFMDQIASVSTFSSWSSLTGAG